MFTNDDLKNVFPDIPEDIDEMISLRVSEKLSESVNSEDKKERGNKMRKGFKLSASAFAAAAILLCTITGYTAYRVFGIGSEKLGNYGTEITIVSEGNYSYNPVFGDTRYVYEIKYGYIPEEMESDDTGWKLGLKDGKGRDFITPILYDLDGSEDDYKKLTLMNVDSTEEMEIGERYATKVKYINGDTWYYVVYAEEASVLEVMCGSELSDELAMSVIENIYLEQTDEALTSENMYTWSDYVKEEKEFVNMVAEDAATTYNAEDGLLWHNGSDLDLLYDVEDEFTYYSEDDDLGKYNLTAKISDVKLYDDLSPLTVDSQIRDEWKEAVGDEGKFVKNIVNYVDYGDGINELDSDIESREVGQKLVYVTFEITNNSEDVAKDVYFYTNYLYLIEDGDKYLLEYLYPRLYMEPVQGADSWDCESAADDDGGMYYMDVMDDIGKNYVPEILPGETAVIHTAFMVNEDTLDYAVIGVQYTGGGYDNVTEDTRIVDIRGIR